jgi:hypothetical protein
LKATKNANAQTMLLFNNKKSTLSVFKTSARKMTLLCFGGHFLWNVLELYSGLWSEIDKGNLLI